MKLPFSKFSNTHAIPFSSKGWLRAALFSVVALALALGLHVSQANAAPTANVITVHIATDGAPGDHYCSLLEANANAYFGADLYPGDCAPGGSENIIRFQDVTNLTPGGIVVMKGNTTIDGGVYGATIHAAPNKRVMYINSGSNIKLENITLTGGNPTSSFADYENFGGGIFVRNSNLYTNNVTFTNNASCNGGGIYAQESILVLTNTTFANNTTHPDWCNNATYGGGGIAFYYGNLYIDRSTFDNNTAFAAWSDGEEADQRSNGNAILIGQLEGVTNAGNATIINSTIKQTDSYYSDADAIHFFDPFGAMTLQNITIDAGDMPYSIWASASNLLVQNTIATSGCNLFAPTLNSNNNLTDSATCAAVTGFTQKTLAELNLQPLSNYGGLTQTIALGMGSAAIDAGSDTVCANTYGVNNLDQRGHLRPFGAHCDIGAFEADGTVTLPVLTPTPVTPDATTTPTQTSVPPTATPTQTSVPPTATATPTTEPVCAAAPTAPTLNTPADGAKINAKNVVLDWTDANCATRYKLVVRDMTTKTDIITKNNLAPSEFTAKKLVSGHKYRWSIQACNAGGCSEKAIATFKIK